MTEAGSRRRPIIGGNWKMNTTLTEAVDLAERLVAGLGAPEGVDVVVFPPFTNLAAVSEILGSGSIGLGAQDVFWEQSGAFTGEISTAMLLSVSATHVIAGHSERRHLLGETDDIVNRKARAALAAGLTVIMAVGETRAQRQANQTERVIADQLRGSLDGVSAGQTADLVIAYEPVWAIGTGETASPPQAQEAHAFIRGWVAERYGPHVADRLRIQYGGSVTGANAADLLAQRDIDGALVGGASLKPDDFAAIVRAQQAIAAG